MTLTSFKKRTVSVLIASALALSLCSCGKKSDSSSTVEEDTTSAKVYIEGTKFMVDGKELWINGVNTPWIAWNDFTGEMDTEAWEKTFAQLEEDGINATRIWVNCTGENIVRLKSTGEIKNINEGHWTDLEKLFEMAEEHHIYVMATLTSFDHFKSTSDNDSGSKWRTLIQDNAMCDAFAETYVGEFCERFGDCEYLFSIDIMNEPDWVYENEECGQIDWEHLSYFFGTCASVIHEKCDVLVTVGTGMVKYNSDNYEGNKVSDAYLQELTGKEDAYLDFYSPHFYAWQVTSFGIPFTKTPEEYGYETSKPILIGETSNDDEDDLGGITLTEKYKDTYDNGWNGLMVWMEYQDDGTWYEYDLTKEATNAMVEYIPDLIYPLGKE